MKDSTKIFGAKTVGDWKVLRDQLLDNSDSDQNWIEAFELFKDRLDTRYFNPINAIKKHNQTKYKGEGFAIMTILCSLIEFLESTWIGKNYRYVYGDDNINRKIEYNKSQPLFIDFLTKRPPFNNFFNYSSARKFYSEVRCGLLHEAATKGDWKIQSKAMYDLYSRDSDGHHIQRNKFEKAIKEYLDFYKDNLLIDQDRQKAFIRKMNHIAGLRNS